jgi:hypothetical protein
MNDAEVLKGTSGAQGEVLDCDLCILGAGIAKSPEDRDRRSP